MTACSSMVVRIHIPLLLSSADSGTQSLTYTGVMKEFGVSLEVATLGLSIFVLGLAGAPRMSLSYFSSVFSIPSHLRLNPVLVGPLSEFYGRTPIYVLGFFFFLVRPPFSPSCCFDSNMLTPC